MGKTIFPPCQQSLHESKRVNEKTRAVKANRRRCIARSGCGLIVRPLGRRTTEGQRRKHKRVQTG